MALVLVICMAMCWNGARMLGLESMKLGTGSMTSLGPNPLNGFCGEDVGYFPQNNAPLPVARRN
jgi:hypothetical protein